jgi:hypothetical protein
LTRKKNIFFGSLLAEIFVYENGLFFLVGLLQFATSTIVFLRFFLLLPYAPTAKKY